MPCDLALARIATKLHDEVADLTDACSADGMPLGFQPSTGVDGQAPVDSGAPGGRPGSTVAFRDEAQVFAGDDLCDGEAVVQLGEIDFVRAYAGGSIGFFAGRFHSRKQRYVGLTIERNIVRRLSNAEHVSGARGVARGLIGRDDHHGCGTVADQGAIVNGKRLCDRLARERLFESDDFAHVRLRIFCAVGVVLHGDGGELFARGAVLVHMAARDHGEQGGESRTRAAFAGHITGACKDLRYARGALRSHFFDASRNHKVVNSGRDALPGVEERRTARSAGIFKTSTRDAAVETGGESDVRSQMILADKGRASEIAEIEGLDLWGGDVPVGNGVIDRFDGKRPQIAIREGAESCFPDTDDSDGSHIHLRIASMGRPSCTFPKAPRHSFIEECGRRTISGFAGRDRAARSLTAVLRRNT
jgi:hypothetical protein